jgi:hypothetical protein
MEVSIG